MIVRDSCYHISGVADILASMLFIMRMSLTFC